MNDKVDAVQESIKLALDAADAATDVTSGYNTVRKQHKILEDKVKQIHKYTTVVFVSSIVSGIFVVIVSAFLFMQGSSKLDTMTETSREALVVFAENVDSVNKSLESLNNAIKKQDVIIKKYGTMDAYYDAAPIVCKVTKDNSLYITAEGLALPCCWTAGRMYKWWHEDPYVEQIWDHIELAGGKEAIDARQGLDRVFKTGIFDTIARSWNLESCNLGKLKVCAMKCGSEFDPFKEQFR